MIEVESNPWDGTKYKKCIKCDVAISALLGRLVYRVSLTELEHHQVMGDLNKINVIRS